MPGHLKFLFASFFNDREISLTRKRLMNLHKIGMLPFCLLDSCASIRWLDRALANDRARYHHARSGQGASSYLIAPAMMDGITVHDSDSGYAIRDEEGEMPFSVEFVGPE